MTDTNKAIARAREWTAARLQVIETARVRAETLCPGRVVLQRPTDFCVTFGALEIKVSCTAPTMDDLKSTDTPAPQLHFTPRSFALTTVDELDAQAKALAAASVFCETMLESDDTYVVRVMQRAQATDNAWANEAELLEWCAEDDPTEHGSLVLTQIGRSYGLKRGAP